jgi:YVTN family beta-propeller protein
MKKMLLVFGALMLMWGCTDYEGEIDGYGFNGGVYLFNGLGDVGTLSVVDNQGVIINDASSLGKYPNNIIELGGILFVVNSGNNNVQMIDASTLQNTGSIELSAFSNPMRAAISNRKLYATNSYGTGVDVYDFDKDSLYTIAITGVPDSCKNGGTDAIISYGTKVFVGVRNVKYDEFWNGIYGSEYIMLIDAANDTVYKTFEAGTNIADMLINDENELHVLSTGNRADIGGFVRVFDLNAINFDTYSTVDLGSQPGSFTLAGSGMVYVAVSGFNPDWTGFGGIMKYNSINNEIINGFDNLIYSSTESGILDICVDGYDNIYAPLFDKNQLVILESDTVKTVLATGNGPQGMVFVKEEE